MLEVTPSVCQRHRQERYLCLPGSDIPAPRTRSPRLPVPPLSPRQPEGRRNQGQLSQDPGKCQRAISHSPGPPPWARPSCNAGPFPLSDSPSPGPEHMLHGGHTGALPWGSSVPWGPCRTSRDMCHLLRAVPRPPGQDSMTSLSWELSQNPRSQQTPTGPWGTGCCPVHGADRRSPHPPHTHTHTRAGLDQASPQGLTSLDTPDLTAQTEAGVCWGRAGGQGTVSAGLRGPSSCRHQDRPTLLRGVTQGIGRNGILPETPGGEVKHCPQGSVDHRWAAQQSPGALGHRAWPPAPPAPLTLVLAEPTRVPRLFHGPPAPPLLLPALSKGPGRQAGPTCVCAPAQPGRPPRCAHA